MSFVQKIFYGPPGTGKTWTASREAVRAVDKQAYDRASQSTNPGVEIAKEHQRLVGEGRIVWVTFHPSFAYEDFVEGFRPTTDPEGRLLYRPVDGPFKQLCNVARANIDLDLQVGEFLPDARGQKTAEVVQKDAGGWLVRVTPERVDEVAPEQFKYVSKLILGQFIKANLPPTVFSIPGKALVDLSEFDINPDDANLPPPDVSKGETREKRLGTLVRRIVAGRAQVSSSDLANSAHYGAAYRRLRELAKRQIERPVAIVIDEINRADVGRVFGDLFTMLDYDKREGGAEAKTIVLPYSKTPFSIPSNVSIIGTMNTIDRSVVAMDFAMRRRFEFELVDVDPTLCPTDYDGIDLQKVLRVINRRISVLLRPDYRIGHAQFMQPSLDALCNRLGWPLVVDAPVEAGATPDPQRPANRKSKLCAIAHVWGTYVIPLLLEYFHDDWQKARVVAGFARAQDGSYELFNLIKIDEWLLEELVDERDLQDAKSFEIATWWNPGGGDWNADRFRAFLQALAKNDRAD